MAKLTREDVERIVTEAREKGERPDLSRADLSRTNLSAMNFRGVDLSGTDLGGADLNKADLIGANLIGANLSQTGLGGASLIEADLIEANLSRAFLVAADLFRADLSGADLSGADLSGADLGGADLSKANLGKVDLLRADLSEADLSEADLTTVDLRWANLTETTLKGADFHGVTVGETTFVNVDLGRVKGLETVKHKSHSIIDINTIHKSGDKIPKVFLEQAGVHPDIIRWQHSLHTRPMIFISYNHKDEAEKDHLLTHLHALQRNDLIDIWHDQRITGGADWKAEIKQAIARASVVILLVSPNFLASDFIFDEEIPAFLERQRSDEKLHLYPIIAKPCNWQAIDWLAKVQVRPKGGQPIWGKDVDTDTELAQITTEITEIIKDLMFK